MSEKYTVTGTGKLLDATVEDETAAAYPADHWRKLMIEGRQLSKMESWALTINLLERTRFRVAHHQMTHGYHLWCEDGDVIFIPYIGVKARTACFDAYDRSHSTK